MRRLFVAVGACAAVSLAGAADPPAAPPPAILTAGRAAALVEQLGSEQFADRESAAAALEKLGTSALPSLRAAAGSESPEVRERAAVLAGKIQRTADSGSRLAARRVKLDYRDTPLGAAVNDLKARTGLNLSLDPNRVANPLRKVTCLTAELPAWEALEAFCAAAGLRETFQADHELPKQTTPRRNVYVAPPQPPLADAVPVVLADGKPERLPGDRATAVRVLALPPSFPAHKVTLGTGEVSLALDVTPVPGLGWQDVVGVKVSKLIDSTGRAGGAAAEKATPQFNDPNGMVVFARPGVAMRFDQNGNIIPPDSLPNPRVVTVPLKLGNPSAGGLRRLEGSVFGELLVSNQHLVVIENPKQNTGKGYPGPGEVKATVLEVKEPSAAGGLGTIKVQLEAPSMYAVNARRRGWNPGWPEAPRMNQGNRIEAFDAAGKPFKFSSSGYSDISDDGLVTLHTYALTFTAGQGVPAKLVVVGSKLVTVEVPFVMENVPLP